jgi:hypothetical protein
MPEIELNPVTLSTIIGAEDLKNDYTSYSLPDYQGFINELQSTGVTLQEDPGSCPLSELTVKIAQIDAQKTRIAAILTLAIKNENGLDVLTHKAHTIYKRESDKQLLKDSIKGLSNKELREAACNIILQELKELVDAIDGSQMQAKSFTRIVATTLDKLDSTNKNISRQITVLQSQMEIGEIQRKSSQENPHTF